MIPKPERLGDDVLTIKDLTQTKGEKLLFENLSFKVPRNAIVGIIGANGAGKTSLFNLIAGDDTPSQGFDPQRLHRCTLLC